MSEEDKKKVEVSEPERKDIEIFHPMDMFRAFDDTWADFRRNFLIPWTPGRLFERPWRVGSMMERRMAYTDLIDNGKEYKITAEVPGITKDRIDIMVTKEGMEISGKVEEEREKEGRGYIVKERGHSEIYRRLSFPEEVIPEKAEATVNHGVLEVRVPKKAPTPKIK